MKDFSKDSTLVIGILIGIIMGTLIDSIGFSVEEMIKCFGIQCIVLFGYCLLIREIAKISEGR